MNRALLELYRHKTWATLRLIEHCQRLPDEHLDATIAGTYGTIRDTLPVPVAELAERIRRLDQCWEALVADTDLPERAVTTTDGYRVTGAVPIAQAIHHAGDHRTQILSILGARGPQVPDLGVWDYAESRRLMQELEATSGD
jgi:uncharacterized damage-inducible protein DinB